MEFGRYRADWVESTTARRYSDISLPRLPCLQGVAGVYFLGEGYFGSACLTGESSFTSITRTSTTVRASCSADHSGALRQPETFTPWPSNGDTIQVCAGPVSAMVRNVIETRR